MKKTIIKQVLGILGALVLFAASNAIADGPYYFSDCDTSGTGAAPDPACVAGDDTTGDGSFANPWRTTAKIQAMIDGTTNGRILRLAKGGKWAKNAPLFLTVCTGAKCTKTNPLVIESYTPAWGGSGTKWQWETTADNFPAFKFEDSGTGEEDHGYVIRDGHIQCFNGTQNSQGFNFYNDPNYITIERVEIDRCAIGVNIGDNNGITTGDPGDGYVTYLSFTDGYIHNNRTQGWLGGCSNCLIARTLFDENGFGNPADSLQYTHNMYISSLGGDTHPAGVTRNMRVIGNTLKNSARCTASTPNGVGGTTCAGLGKLNKCDGTNLVVHGQHKGLLIENNVIDESANGANGGCYGIQVNTGYGSEGEYFLDAVIRGNKIINVGSVGIGTSAAPYVLVEGNEIIWTVNDNSNRIGIASPDGSVLVGDSADANGMFRNNTVYINGTGTLKGIMVKNPGSNLAQRVVSNLVVFGPNVTSTAACFDADATAANYSVWDNNFCYSAGATPKVNSIDASAGLFSAWQSGGRDTHGVCCATDPKIDTPTSGNSYSVKPNNSTSPLRNAAHPTLSKRLGIRGQKNPDASPFIGANPYNATVTAPNAPNIQ